jgi:cytochrome c5
MRVLSILRLESTGVPAACLCAALLSPSFGACAANGEAVYKATCSACHESGAGNAPRVSVALEWKERFAAGRAALQHAALTGVPNTAMAAKGGFAELSDAEVRAAVDYMLAQSGFVEPASPRPNVRSAVTRGSSAAGEPRPSDVVLAARVAAALRAALAPTAPIEPHDDTEFVVRGIGVRVRALDDVVRLMGVVQDSGVAKRAEAIAASIAGVRGVDSKLVAGGMLDFD